MAQPVICLMGPTASGKTHIAVELAQQLPIDVISVDSAMVYRGMDIGTAKPDAATLKLAPHQLIDLCDPAQTYSAGDFQRDALAAISTSHTQGRIPFLVGGTMLYFKTLLQGLSNLPQADVVIRQRIADQAQAEGWPALHAALTKVDPEAAAKIKPMDKQRIQRALEVFYASGKPISAWQQDNGLALPKENVYWLALMPQDRAALHARIALRFEQMLQQGFLFEVEQLMRREDLHADLPSQRAVGYRQAWQYLSGGEQDHETFKQQAIAATRQLCKRQITWLRSWPYTHAFDLREANACMQVCRQICL